LHWGWGMATKVCLLGHRHLFRAGLARILHGELFEVLLEVATLPELRDAEWDSGLVVVDKPDEIADIEADIRELKERAPGCRVVVLAHDMDARQMMASFALGIDGYLLDEISPAALRESLQLVMTGEFVFPSKLMAVLLNDWTVASSRRVMSAEGVLSERETEIVARLADGLPNKVIANELTITEATVKVHLKSILKKLGVSNRTQVAVWAINRGMSQVQQSAS